MANTNTNRKRKKSKYSKKSENAKFNKKSFSIFFMFISLIGFIFLILPNTGRLGDFITYNNFKLFGFMSYFIFLFVFTSFLFVFIDKFKANFRVFNILFILILLTMAILSMKF
ncbi:MAG: DNA translocase FtsK, partial [Anaerococcus sp.]|nr:DNA translocase FtsK [Anaerococcus sp.]